MDKAIKAARLADQIRDYMALWIHQEYPPYLFSITQVTLSPDLRIATIWIETEQAEQLFKTLEKKTSHYQHKINQSLQKSQFIKLVFRPDISQEMNQKLDQLLK